METFVDGMAKATKTVDDATQKLEAMRAALEHHTATSLSPLIITPSTSGAAMKDGRDAGKVEITAELDCTSAGSTKGTRKKCKQRKL